MTSELNAAAANNAEREKTINCKPLNASGMVFIDDAPDLNREQLEKALEYQPTNGVECVLYPWQREVISNLEKEAGKEVKYSSIRHELLCDYARSLKTRLNDEKLKVERLREALEDLRDGIGDQYGLTECAIIIQQALEETAGE